MVGKRGVSGRDGVQGVTGAQGVSGERGSPGVKGDRGTNGRDGRPGRDGRVGPAGLAGKRGEQGPTGPTGTYGKDGAVDTPGSPQSLTPKPPSLASRNFSVITAVTANATEDIVDFDELVVEEKHFVQLMQNQIVPTMTNTFDQKRLQYHIQWKRNVFAADACETAHKQCTRDPKLMTAALKKRHKTMEGRFCKPKQGALYKTACFDEDKARQYQKRIDCLSNEYCRFVRKTNEEESKQSQQVYQRKMREEAEKIEHDMALKALEVELGGTSHMKDQRPLQIRRLKYCAKMKLNSDYAPWYLKNLTLRGLLSLQTDAGTSPLVKKAERVDTSSDALNGIEVLMGATETSFLELVSGEGKYNVYEIPKKVLGVGKDIPIQESSLFFNKETQDYEAAVDCTDEHGAKAWCERIQAGENPMIQFKVIVHEDVGAECCYGETSLMQCVASIPTSAECIKKKPKKQYAVKIESTTFQIFEDEKSTRRRRLLGRCMGGGSC
jgi:hypothetical protein